MLLLRQTILPMYFFIDKYRYECSFHWQIQVSRYCLSEDLRLGMVIAFWRRSQFGSTGTLFSLKQIQNSIYTLINPLSRNLGPIFFAHFRCVNCLIHIFNLSNMNFIFMDFLDKILNAGKSLTFLTLFLLNPDIPWLCKLCRSRSVGFWRSHLIWICTVCHSVY